MARFETGINDFGTLRPEPAAEWDYEENAPLSPKDVSLFSNKKVWWICKKCGHSWQAPISERSRGVGCPQCRYSRSASTRQQSRVKQQGSLGDNHPELLKEWDYSKNAEDPSQIFSNTHKLFWWKCAKCGATWQASPYHRVRGWMRCEKCYGISNIRKGKKAKAARLP